MNKSTKRTTNSLKTKWMQKKTFFALFVINLFSINLTVICNATTVYTVTPNHKKVISDYQLPVAVVKKPSANMSTTVEISRSTSLYDFQDGTRSDGLDIMLAPNLSTSIGNFYLRESYSRNLRDNDDTANGISDATIGYSYLAIDLEWAAPYILTMTPSVSLTAPLSNISIHKNQLITAFNTNFKFGLRPDNLTAQQIGEWSASVAISAGRSFHQFQEDIQGVVLNQYSSNQTLGLNYSVSDFNFSIGYTNRSRWTYQGNIKQSFVFGQELSYSIYKQLYITAGHSNDAASVLKDNGYESNIQVIDENNSGIYVTLGNTF